MTYNQLENIDEEIIVEAERILDDVGLNIGDVLKIVLKRISREKNVTFLFQNNQKATGNDIPCDYSKNSETGFGRSFQTKTKKTKMTKTKAVALFRNQGIYINNNVTFASKNRGADNYWANPHFDVLKNDWYLILNDWIEEKLYLFYIPKNSIKEHDLVCRADKEERIDLQIMYKDVSFTDIRSKISFANYLIKTI